VSVCRAGTRLNCRHFAVCFVGQGYQAGSLALLAVSTRDDACMRPQLSMRLQQLPPALTLFMNACRQASVAHSRHSVLPVPVGLSSSAFSDCRTAAGMSIAGQRSVGSVLGDALC
jgi:hypothetical protein